MVEERATYSRSIGLFTILAIFALFAMLLASAGIYFYKITLDKNIVDMKSQLELARNDFEPSKILELQILGKHLTSAKEVLSQHVSVAPIFQALAAVTMKTVRFTGFTYNFDQVSGKVNVTMKGTAVGYRSVALQSDLFGTNKSLIDPIFSNLTLDDKGNVLFDLEFSVDQSFVDYAKVLAGQTKT